jgi:hypothetical protein
MRAVAVTASGKQYPDPGDQLGYRISLVHWQGSNTNLAETVNGADELLPSHELIRKL